MIRIERATRATVDEWVALRAALWPKADRRGLEREAIALLDQEAAAAAFVARDETGAAVGFAEATLRTDYVNGCSTSPVGFLEGLYVQPKGRRRGTARLLCAAVEAWARGLGVGELASDTEIGNEASQRMHAALGFTEAERCVCYCKRLP
ncbi:MAG: GNAT family N-acetyltransferase [Proteobacteria bacterium]|nr:GNAT family N-acetyltransferase [Pseudomonadota bacterium]